MNTFIIALLLQSALQAVNAHYSLSVIKINGKLSGDWQYVRKTDPIANPWYDVLDANAIRCGPNATISADQTETATVLAGDTVTFIVGPSSPYAEYGFYHPGVAYGYLSRAPGDLESYAGDGEWFKIAQLGAINDTQWTIDADKYAMNITIPKATPPGKYLLRAEQIYSYWGTDNQIYLNCAHIEVLGEGVGTPGPMVRFPGAYKPSDRSLNPPDEWVINTRWAEPPLSDRYNLSDYEYLGPPVWRGRLTE
ncbi:hypothetical protein CC78DRAFT_617452 [Lojkania enalia]|uniref:lytic cellulose monooxygenase (C4-dehydrogenating) n=1 Tax=Lojkania enalia TaxID=147567 RepID=A0A9P4N2S2_9PLEO|nr:hypothetical protein CC78DRAFT_617452 [Didymosphaeria enalia]